MLVDTSAGEAQHGNGEYNALVKHLWYGSADKLNICVHQTGYEHQLEHRV